MKTRKVPLQIRTYRYCGSDHRPWRMSVPFAMSRAGILVHRVRQAGSFVRDGVYSHDYVSYWCGNGTTQALFFENPPDKRIVCATCESRAVAHGMPTTDSLVGKHVHIGVLKAHKTCCDDNN